MIQAVNAARVSGRHFFMRLPPPRYAWEFQDGEAVDTQKAALRGKQQLFRLLHHKKESDYGEKLEHTRWNCKYHVVWAPKYRRKIIYGKYRSEIGKILRRLCEYKGIEIVEANSCIDHIHMCLRIPPKFSVAQIMGYLKGKSSLMIFEQFSNLKYKYGNRHFWCKGYFVSIVGINEATISSIFGNKKTMTSLYTSIA